MRAKWLCVAVAVMTVLAGCGRAESLPSAPTLSLAPPIPAGMDELPPVFVPPPQENPDNDCDLTASLRPFPARPQTSGG